MKIVINSDGGARGNPGLAGVGFVIKADNKVVFEWGKAIGEATNNQAEYKAIKHALGWVNRKFKGEITAIEAKLDSELVVKQLKAEYKIKNIKLKSEFLSIQKEIREIKNKFPKVKIEFKHVIREKNERADELANLAMDGLLDGECNQ